MGLTALPVKFSRANARKRGSSYEQAYSLCYIGRFGESRRTGRRCSWRFRG
jgi:hypothetical protein